MQLATSITNDLLSSPDWDRMQLETGEARTLVAAFIHNGESQDWLANALRVSQRRYGTGSTDRIKTYMRSIWKEELLK